MTVETNTQREDYTGTGAVDTYPFNFKIFAETDLVVVERDTDDVETTLVLNTDYTVDGVGLDAGGNVVLTSNLTLNHVLTILRRRPVTQSSLFRNQTTFYPSAHEEAFDHGIMVDQQQQEEIDRSLKLPDSVSADDFDPTLPAEIVDAASAGRAIVVNDDNDGLIMGPDVGDIAAAAANAAAAAASAAAALVSENNAETAETNAEAAQAAAESAAAAIIFNEVVFLDDSDSPITLTNASRGKMYVIDCAGGNVTLNLPSIATLTFPWNVGIKKLDAANTLTINRNGTDTIDDGATSYALTVDESGVLLVPEDSVSPDNWTSVPFGVGNTPADNSITTAKLVNLAVTTAKIDDGAVTTAKLDDEAVTIAKIAAAFFPSGYLHLDTGAGFGSTNTAIRRFANARVNTSDAFTYADSAGNGGSITIDEDGIYVGFFVDCKGSGGSGQKNYGFSVNTSGATTSIASLTYAAGKRCIAVAGEAANEPGSPAVFFGPLVATDVVRAHCDRGNAPSSENSNTILFFAQVMRLP